MGSSSKENMMQRKFVIEAMVDEEEEEENDLPISITREFYIKNAPPIFREIEETLEWDKNTPLGKMLNQFRIYDRSAKCIICDVNLQLPDRKLSLEEPHEWPTDVPLNRVHLIECGHAFHHTCLVGLLIIGRAKYPETWAACPDPTCREPFDMHNNNDNEGDDNNKLIVHRIWFDGTARQGDLMEYINRHRHEGLPIDRECVADVIEYQKAIIMGNYDLASSYLDSNGFLHQSGKVRGPLSVNSGLVEEEDMLQWCAAAGDYEGVDFLLKKGADKSRRFEGKNAWDMTRPNESGVGTEGRRKCRQLLDDAMDMEE